MKKLMLPLCLLAVTMLCASPASAATTKPVVNVYCVNGKVMIDQRTKEQMKSAHGSNAYVLGEFSYRTDAEKLAKKFGGEGKQCPKK